MDAGFNVASLAVFTALAPAGAVAFALLAVFLLVRSFVAGPVAPDAPDDPLRRRLEYALAVPLTVVWVGFIASATHLGTPANALHVVAGIGRSPLSNEVAAVAVFLFAAGVCWMHSFRERRSELLTRVLLGACVAAAAGLVAFTARAYGVATVPSWDTWYTPANMVLGGLFAGAALAAGVLACAGEAAGARAAGNPTVWARVLVLVAAALLVGGTVVLAMHAWSLRGIANNVESAADLVPWYPVAVAIHALLGACGLVLQVAGMRRRKEGRAVRVERGRARIAFEVSGCLLVLVAVLAARFPFYASYLPAGF